MNTSEIITKMREIPWSAGAHEDHKQACITEAAAWATGAPWSDTPPCWPREISLLAQKIHDATPPKDYATVWTDARLAAMFAAEHGDEASRRRACQAAEFARLAYVARHPGSDAAKCAPIVDCETAIAARNALREDASYYASYYAAYAAYAANAADAADVAYAACLAILDIWIGHEHSAYHPACKACNGTGKAGR